MLVSNKVHLTDESNRFMADVDGKAHEAVWDLTVKMTQLANNYAPMRSGRLRQSIEGYMFGPLQGAVVAKAPYAKAQEFGARPHPIGEEGQILAKGAQSFIPQKFAEGGPPTHAFGPVRGPVNHPGNPGVHYMARAFTMMRQLAPAVFRRHLGD